MAQHDSLRSTGRARGVQKASDLAGAILLDGFRLRIRIERTNTDSTERSHSVYLGADAAGVIGRFRSSCHPPRALFSGAARPPSNGQVRPFTSVGRSSK